MGLLSKDDLDYYLSQLGAYFAIMLRDNPGNPYKELYSHYCAVREHIETLEKTNEWISVKGRLPTYAELKDEHVLVLFDDGFICSTGFDECIEGEKIFGEWRQNFDPVTLGATDSDWMPLEGVTHWMPMPKLPKEDAK